MDKLLKIEHQKQELLCTNRFTYVRGEQFEEIFGRVAEGFLFVDDKRQLTYINEHFESLLGVDSRALTGKNVWSLFPLIIGSFELIVIVARFAPARMSCIMVMITMNLRAWLVFLKTSRNFKKRGAHSQYRYARGNWPVSSRYRRTAIKGFVQLWQQESAHPYSEIILSELARIQFIMNEFLIMGNFLNK
jgi:PAS domain-containing protein